MKTLRRATPFLVFALAVVFGSVGCGSSGSDAVEGSGGSGHVSGADRQAEAAALAELQRHWLKGGDGWTAAEVGGSPYAPDHFLRQYRELIITGVEPQELGESDKLNGFEWAGTVTFKKTVCREAGGQQTYVMEGLGDGQQAYVEKQPGRWSQWIDMQPGPLRLQKHKGAWQFQWDGSYLRGTLPGPQDFAMAGVR
jgi:hypothetical protein